MNSNGKAKAQRIHARTRADERLGLQPDWDRLLREIQTGKVRCIQRQSLRVSIFRVKVPTLANGVAGECFCRAVYDKKRHQIVTLMPEKTEG